MGKGNPIKKSVHWAAKNREELKSLTLGFYYSDSLVAEKRKESSESRNQSRFFSVSNLNW